MNNQTTDHQHHTTQLPRASASLSSTKFKGRSYMGLDSTASPGHTSDTDIDNSDEDLSDTDSDDDWRQGSQSTVTTHI